MKSLLILRHAKSSWKHPELTGKLEELIEMLTGEIHIMPTCSLVHVKLHDDSWLDIDYETKGKLVDMWQPGA